MTNKKDELSKLKARGAELEERIAKLEADAKAAAAPPKPFVPEPFQRYDPTAGMSMPPSALRAMVAAEPRGFMQGVVHDNRAPTGRPGMIPSSQQPSRGSANVPGSGTGWGAATPLSPPPGIQWVDAQLDAQDAKDRAELREREARLQTMEKLAEQSEIMRQQTEALAKLVKQK